MEDTVTELHLAVQQLSIAMFTGLGVTQRDATTADTRPLVSSPASGGGGGGEDGSVATEDKESFRESVAQLAVDVANKARSVLQILDRLGEMEEQVCCLEDSLSEEQDAIATERLKEEWKETCQVYEALKQLETFASRGL